MATDARYSPRRSGLLRRFGTRSTQLVAQLVGHRFPFYYVSEYPRSGGTWLGEMLAAYLDLPLPHQPLGPVLHSAVLHNHWGYSSRLKKVYYLYRDGRDVCTSMYFFCLRALAHDNVAMRNYYRGKLPQAVDENWQPEDSRKNMAKFIEIWATNPMGCRITWHEHVQQWALDRPDVITVSYEQLREDCAGTLARIIPKHISGDVNRARIEDIVQRFSFAKMTGRKPGAQDANSFMRKGVVGDWQNHFDREAAITFDRYAGQLLVQLGYESDRLWVNRVSENGVQPDTAVVSK